MESIEETGNRADTVRIDKNQEIDESNIMCQSGAFKGLKVLSCMFLEKGNCKKRRIRMDWPKTSIIKIFIFKSLSK